MKYNGPEEKHFVVNLLLFFHFSMVNMFSNDLCDMFLSPVRWEVKTLHPSVSVAKGLPNPIVATGIYLGNQEIIWVHVICD